MFDGQQVRLSLQDAAKLTARYLGTEAALADIPDGSRGVVVSVLEVSGTGSLATVRFDGYRFALVIPTKYLKAS
jgi:hypothetical protein